MIKPNKLSSVFLASVMMFTILQISMVHSGNVYSEVATVHLQDSLIHDETASRSLFSLNNPGDDLVEKDDKAEKSSFSILRLNVFIYLFYKIFYNKP